MGLLAGILARTTDKNEFDCYELQHDHGLRTNISAVKHRCNQECTARPSNAPRTYQPECKPPGLRQADNSNARSCLDNLRPALPRSRARVVRRENRVCFDCLMQPGYAGRLFWGPDRKSVV